MTLIKISTILLAITSLAACNVQSNPAIHPKSPKEKRQSSKSDNQQTTVEETVQDKFVTIIAVKGEKDGDTVIVKDRNGKVYTAIISPANLGPNSNYDFKDTKVGNTLVISGESSNYGSGNKIHINKAARIIVD